MASEITLSAAIAYLDSVLVGAALSIARTVVSVATKKIIHNAQSIGTSEEAIVLGEVTSPGWSMFINRDPTNYIELRVSTGGAKFAKLLGSAAVVSGYDFALLRLGSGAQVPYAIADTSSCVLEYLLCMT